MLRTLCLKVLKPTQTLSRSMSSHTGIYFTPDTGDDKPEVIVTNHGFVRVLTLNRPKALNSLNRNMIQIIYPKLKKYEKSSGVYSVIIEGAGPKAFCAGGDVKALYLEMVNNTGSSLCQEFFREEYRLNHRIATMKTNYIALLDGITMGGGVGLSVHGRFRVATENTVFAMPETAIGFFPDVGGSFFLPRLEGQLGMYLALTGSTLCGQDVKHAGIATHYVASRDIGNVRERILEVEYDPESVDWAIRERSSFDRKKPSLLMERLPLINECFGKSSVEEIIEALKASNTTFGDETVETMGKVSPLSLKVSFKQLREGSKMSLEECFKMENRIASHMMTGESDFLEGVRAVLIDKDHAPKWKHKSITDVPDDDVNAFFAHVADELILTPSRI